MKKLNGLILHLFILFFSPIIFANHMCWDCTHPKNKAGAVKLFGGAGYEFFASKRDIKNTDFQFFAIGYNFSDQFGIEGLAGFFNTHFKESVADPRGITGNLYAIDGIYRFPLTRVQPYVLFGVGATGLSHNKNEAHNEGNINAGIGLEIFADEIVALRVEGRDFYTIVGGKNDVVLNAGVSFSIC